MTAQASSNALFGRLYSLQIAPHGQSASARYGNRSSTAAPLRLQFEVVQDATAVPNKAKITIFNMNRANRSALTVGYALDLYAGYQSLIDRLFYGVVNKVTSEKQDADMATTIECGDGQAPICYARFDRNYPAGTTTTQVFNDIVQVLQARNPAIPFGIDRGSIASFPVRTFQRGAHFHGKCRDALNRLFAPLGYDWYVLNNALNVVSKRSPSGDGTVYLSRTSGLIGVPSRNQDNAVVLTSLLNPRIVPGRQIKLQSLNDSFDGFYVVKKSEFKGDTHGQEWQVTAECTPLYDTAMAGGDHY